MNLQFVAKIFNHAYRVYAGYVPRNIIEFNNLNPSDYFDSSWHDGKISYRESSDIEWKDAAGFLGYYKSRNTLRIIFSPFDGSDPSGKLIEFKIENY